MNISPRIFQVIYCLVVASALGIAGCTANAMWLAAEASPQRVLDDGHFWLRFFCLINAVVLILLSIVASRRYHWRGRAAVGITVGIAIVSLDLWFTLMIGSMLAIVLAIVLPVSKHPTY